MTTPLAANEATSATNRELHPGTWVAEHAAYLFRYALHRVSETAVAEELVQETFLAALEARASFEGRSSVRTWLTSILRNKIADHFRARGDKATTESPRFDDWCEDLFNKRGAWKKKRGAWPPMPESAPEKRELTKKLEECLGRLPAHVAEMFVLYEQRGIAGERIAEATGVTTGTLWVRLYRARLALRECLVRNWLGGES